MKHSFPPDTPYDNHDNKLTLTERKEQAFAAQERGRQIVNLSARQLRYVPLEGKLQKAILEARRLTHRGSVTRQLLGHFSSAGASRTICLTAATNQASRAAAKCR